MKMSKDLISEDFVEEAENLASSFSGGWWNYRIIENEMIWTGNNGKVYNEVYYTIHEVYYDGKGNPIAWTENPMKICFDDYEDYKDIIKHLKKIKKKTILKLVKEGEDEKLIDTGKYLKHIKNTF